MVNSASPSLFRRFFVDAILPATLLLTAGCGGGDEAASDSTATAAPADAAASGGAGAAMGMAPPDPAAMSGGAAMPGAAGMSAMPGMMPPAGSESSGGAPAGYAGGSAAMTPGAAYPGAPDTAQSQVVARPNDVASWTDEQMVDAVHERDPKLLDAIDSRVKASPGDPKVAEMLTSLLTALANPRAATTTQQNGVAGYPGYGADPAAVGAASGAPASYPGYPGGNSSSGAAPAMVAPAGAYAAPGAAPGVAPGAMPADSSSSSSSSSSSGSSASGEGRAPIQSAPPSQSSIQRRNRGGLAIDSISLMVLESSTAYFQNPAVGAIAGRSIPGAVGAVGPADSSSSSSSSGGASNAGVTMPPGAMPGTMPAGAAVGVMPAGAAAGAPMNYPGAEYAGGSYPGSGAGMPGSNGAMNGGLQESQLIERIVDGLIQNGSPSAWQTIYGIASQTVKTPLPPGVGAEIVTQALYRNIDRNPAMIEPILISLVDGSAQLPPESRSVALRVTAQVSGLAADKLTGFQTLAALPTAGGQMGMPGMAGGSAGIGMAGQAMSSYPGAAGMPAGASSAVAYPGGAAAAADGYAGVSGAAVSAAGMAGGGMPGGSAGGAAPPMPLMPDAALMRAASFLWGPKFVEALVKQLDASNDIGLVQGFVGGGDFVRIAATIPNDRVRKALATLFEKTAPASVGQLGMTGFFSSSVHDPGMLIAMKSLPRTKPSRAEAAQGAPMDEWSTANLDVVLSLRDRMRALAATPGKLTPVTDNLPIRLHKNAVPEFYGVLTLPGPAASALKDSAPSATKVYYARTSFTPEKPKDQQDLAGHYESRATGIKRASESKGVLLWVDGFKATQAGSKRTADVIVQSSTGGGGAVAGGGYGESGAPGIPSGYGSQAGAAGGGGGGAFSIEIIVVETTEPKAVADASASTAGKK